MPTQRSSPTRSSATRGRGTSVTGRSSSCRLKRPSASVRVRPESRFSRPTRTARRFRPDVRQSHVSQPESLPSPRGAHLEMVGAVLAGDGLERIAEIAQQHTGAPVAVIVPRLGTPLTDWAQYERYVA